MAMLLFFTVVLQKNSSNFTNFYYHKNPCLDFSFHFAHKRFLCKGRKFFNSAFIAVFECDEPKNPATRSPFLA